MPATADDIAQLKSLEDRRYAAMLAGDADGIADLLHDELIYMHSIGGADSKDSYLRTLRDGSMGSSPARSRHRRPDGPAARPRNQPGGANFANTSSPVRFSVSLAKA